MNNRERLLELVESTLTLLEPYANDSKELDNEPLISLLRQCELACEALENASSEPISMIHHFACTGGTILSRAIAAQPNTVLLSEVDPFSTLAKKNPSFAPTDVIGLSQLGVRPASASVVEDMFLASLETLYRDLLLIGRRLVLRDHAHSQFCTEVDPGLRPTLRRILAERFAVRSAVTVRHPLDSYLSLTDMGWVQFAPATLEEYSNRYHCFLDAYSGAAIFRYEDFITDPDREIREMTDVLALPFNPNWRDLLSIISLTGDSGRKSDNISERPRRPAPENIKAETVESSAYHALCDRLGYDPDTDAPPVLKRIKRFPRQSRNRRRSAKKKGVARRRDKTR